MVQQLRNKDKVAFTQVFEQYFNLLVLYANRFLDTREEAEEIAQDVFVKFWEKCETLDPDSSIKGYLYRSVHNACLNEIKHQKVKDVYKEFIIQFMETSYNLEKEVDTAESRKDRISREINKLPPKCKEIFELSRFEGLKYQEIADHLMISIKTVEVQMGKALKALRENLGDLDRRRS
ncbi:MAG: RNA polymerase sigma-70 factor [Bacteroidota bacterium]